MRRLAFMLLAAVAVASSCKEDPAIPKLKSANELYAKKDYRAAAAEFEEAFKLNPTQELKIYEKAAFSWMNAGEYDKATALLVKTLDLKPDTKGKVETYRNIAGMYMQTADDPKKAEQYFAEILKLDPKDEQSLTWLAEISSKRGGARANDAEPVVEDLEKALELYNKLIEINPALPANYINKRIVLTKLMSAQIKLKAVAEADAEENKADKVTQQDFLDEAKKHQQKADEIKVLLDETTKKLSEALKAAKK